MITLPRPSMPSKGTIRNTSVATIAEKEVHVVLKSGQHMEPHEVPFPICIEIIKGSIHLEVGHTKHVLVKGNQIRLQAHCLHGIHCISDCSMHISILK